MSQQTETRSYKSTLNLPRTILAMKANLVQNEPATMKRWEQMNLYQQIRQRPHPKGRYVFHDGPPYANGPIHLGHLLNKVLKDLVVRSKTMAGYDCPFVPGWDCHGLPIEHKVVQELGERAGQMSPMQIRHRCRGAAEKFIKLQASQMQRLLTLADYGRPYITMDPAYEAAVLEVFASVVAKGLVYRMKKSVQWSVENQTALADAELEYYERQDTSVYVFYEIHEVSALPASLNAPRGAGVVLMIWTTTPWTLPANLAVAIAPQARYSLFRFTHRDRSRYAILADELGPKVLHFGGASDVARLGTCAGMELERSDRCPGVSYRQPLTGWICPVVTADYVTLEDGTGLVHTAPGHGAEDYETGCSRRLHFKRGLEGATAVCWVSRDEIKDLRRKNLDPPEPDIYCPVRVDGTYDQTVPEWLRGMLVWEANTKVTEYLRGSGHLFHDYPFVHSYPHDWRGKSPIIFRATEQWFLSVDRQISSHDWVGSGAPPNQLTANEGQTLRDRALRVVEDQSQIDFIPQWGRNRMRGMLESRPDWCLSRQRAWGLPIPVFYGQDGTALLTERSVRVVADKVKEHGSDYWFTASVDNLLDGYDPQTDPQAPRVFTKDSIRHLCKGDDILDVWFESGSSWYAALRRMQGDFSADLYLEGSDQHRGWFQLSLLPSLSTKGQSPFKAVLTHGFMVDKEGRKMSKSLGNTLDVDDLLKKFGADVCRWWVSSLNTDNDIKVDHKFFTLAGEEYRKIRNTIRYLLGNLNDYTPEPHRLVLNDADGTSIDAWALGQLGTLVKQSNAAYERFQFRWVHEALFDFCNRTMSAVYLTAAKDRLYCDAPDSRRRRRTQTVMYRIADALIHLIAPILPHTADEAWRALEGQQTPSVHMKLLPHTEPISVSEHWEEVMVRRDTWMKQIESVRQDAEIDNPLDLGLRVPCSGTSLGQFDPIDLADLCGVSRVELVEHGDAVEVIDLRAEPRCQRCWKRDGTVKLRRDGGMLSDRDAAVLGV